MSEDGQSKKKKNENVLSGEVAYIEILSFLWNIPSRWIRILIGGFLSGGILFLKLSCKKNNVRSRFHLQFKF